METLENEYTMYTLNLRFATTKADAPIKKKYQNYLEIEAPETIKIDPKQILMLDLKANFSLEESVAVPFLYKDIVRLGLKSYFTDKGFAWKGQGRAQFQIINNGKMSVTLKKGSLIGRVFMMTEQYYELYSKKNNSDKGLASARVNVTAEYNCKD